ncbi:MAG TPA: hypothetical protein VF993_02505 [Myxococcales bacterium]
MRRKIVGVAVTLAVLAGALGLGRALHLPSLGARPAQVGVLDLASLQKEFDAEIGRTRLLALLSPT